MQRSKTIFDIINDISYSKVPWENQLESDRKKTDIYMIQRWLSMKPEYLEIVSGVQPIAETMGQKQFYEFYSGVLPKKKFYTKYIKKTNKSDKQYHRDLLKLISDQCNVSLSESEKVADTCDKKQLAEFVRSHGHKEREFGL